MKKIKVYMQYPFGESDSPYYKYLIDNPPKNIEYLNTEKQKGVIIKKKNISSVFLKDKTSFIKDKIRKAMVIFRISIPNAYYTKTQENYDLIHCGHCLSKNTNKPWVADIESDWQISVSGQITKRIRSKVQKILLQDNCKKIAAWTKETGKILSEFFPEAVDKIEVIYPAIPAQRPIKRNSKEIVLLFVGRYFYAKGGLHALKVMDKITRENKNVRGVIVSEIPSNIKLEYSKNEKVTFYDLMPQDKLFKEIYPTADIFLYPGYSDTFGFGMLEAMSFGLPVITVDGYARKEIVDHEKTGFVVDAKGKRDWSENHFTIENENEVLSNLTSVTVKLVKDKGLRNKMSLDCVKEIEKGKFSIKIRNEKLEKMYEDALN